MPGVPIPVPQLGVIEVVVVVEWLAVDGDDVDAGQPIVVVGSEKAETEIEAPVAGRLEIVVEADPDAEIAVGTVLGRILVP
jgi:pyruvate/2-oxoglutarate dehydrogenase complex dihydrolipoamide acyltransferase (E2) component